MLDGCTPWPVEFAVRYREAGYWTGETFSDFFTDRTRRFADRLAVVGAGQRWTYAELGERAAVLATGLARLGIAAGDRVVVQLPNIPELFEVIVALFYLGALPVYALPAHRAHEITHLCTTAQAKALIIPDRHRRLRLPGHGRADAPRRNRARPRVRRWGTGRLHPTSRTPHGTTRPGCLRPA